MPITLVIKKKHCRYCEGKYSIDVQFFFSFFYQRFQETMKNIKSFIKFIYDTSSSQIG